MSGSATELMNYHGDGSLACSIAALLNFHILHIQIGHLMYTGNVTPKFITLFFYSGTYMSVYISQYIIYMPG